MGPSTGVFQFLFFLCMRLLVALSRLDLVFLKRKAFGMQSSENFRSLVRLMRQSISSVHRICRFDQLGFDLLVRSIRQLNFCSMPSVRPARWFDGKRGSLERRFFFLFSVVIRCVHLKFSMILHHYADNTAPSFQSLTGTTGPVVSDYQSLLMVQQIDLVAMTHSL